MIAGIIQGNARQSPFVNPEAAKRRRNYTLDRMATEGYITPPRRPTRQGAADRRRAATRPRGAASRRTSSRRSASISRAATARKPLYESGLTVRTRARPAGCSAAANQAVDAACAASTSADGFRKPRGNVIAEGHRLSTPTSIDRWARPHRRRRHRAGGGRAASSRHRARPRGVRIGTLTAELDARGLCSGPASHVAAGWSGGRSDRRRAADHRCRRRHGDGAARADADPRRRARRHRQPHRPGAGDGRRLQLRAQQVQPRDAGAIGRWARPSSRFLYTAAIDRGLTPATILDRRADELRRRRRPAALFAAQLRPQVRGPADAAPRARAVAQHPAGEGDGDARARRRSCAYAEKLRPAERRFRRSCRRRSAPGKSTLLEMTSAYSAFPNHGVRMEPYWC